MAFGCLGGRVPKHNDENVAANDLVIFELQELTDATHNFDASRVLGEGGYSKVYKGTLNNGREVAIKKHVKMEEQQAFWDEYELLKLEHLRHPNIIRMIGHHASEDNLLMVMELMPLKSLDKSLFESTGQLLDWDARLKIAEGVARGLQYLHSQDVVVRDVKPHNILLGEEFDAKLADFGVAILNASRTSGETTLKGTRGYMDQGEYRGRERSPKQDVYSFGMVLFELMTGRKTTAFPPPPYCLRRVMQFENNIDPRMTNAPEGGPKSVLLLAEKCLATPDKRLTMAKVVSAISQLRLKGPTVRCVPLQCLTQ